MVDIFETTETITERVNRIKQEYGHGQKDEGDVIEDLARALEKSQWQGRLKTEKIAHLEASLKESREQVQDMLMPRSA